MDSLIVRMKDVIKTYQLDGTSVTVLRGLKAPANLFYADLTENTVRSR